MRFATIATITTVLCLSFSFASASPLGLGFGANISTSPHIPNPDYIIVGGGTAGLALANRLSENPSMSIVVLEAGGDFKKMIPEGVFIDVPVADVLGCGADRSDNMQEKTDWGIVTVPQAGANNRKIRYARGKTLGGSSARNFMIYQRPNVGSMSMWQTLTGDKSWGFWARFNDFKRGITYTKADARRNDVVPIPDDSASFAPAGGALKVSYPREPAKFSFSMAESMVELGYPRSPSFNKGTLDGVQFAATTIDPANNGIRSTSRDFYAAVSGRANLKVYTRQAAMQVVFDKSTSPLRAIGVRTVDGSLGAATIYAKKEVILSAGAFQSPQLLMVSGIGPSDQLSKFNIPVTYLNEAVGKNMQDHIFAGPTYPVSVSTLTKLATNNLLILSEVLNMRLTGNGPLTNNVADMLAWDHLELEHIESDRSGGAGYYIVAPGSVKNFSNLIAENKVDGKNGQQYASILGALVAPRSLGSVTLKSASMADLPVVDPAWLTDPVDQAVAVESFKRIRRVGAAVQNVGDMRGLPF
ncbi:unnamed protein product [Tilletia controversa]|nr:unnamed protein product [Tilletia controversa]